MKRFALIIISLMVSFSPFISLRWANALGANLITNPSAEVQTATAPALPTDWTKNRWGTNTYTFSYTTSASNAQDNSKSLYAQIKTYSSGDIKWSHKEVTVVPNTSYTFSNFYKSNISSEIVVQTKSTNNVLTYKTLKLPVAASAWTKNSIAFTTSSTAKAVTVFHLINKVGWLSTDNYYLGLTGTTPPPTIPTVSMTAPAADGTVTGTTTLSATASDSSGIAGVQFMADNVKVGAEDTTSPYSINWDTTTATNGTHSLTAVARNASGTTANSTSRSVTVSNSIAPTVTISAPAASSTVSATTTVSATAANATSVQFKLDNLNLGNEVTTNPYNISWDTTTATNGTHNLTAIARNAANETITSAAVNITVSNVVSPPVNPSNLVLNPSMETADTAVSAKPQGWLNSSWGTNTSAFTYETTGRTGSRSLKTQVTSYTSGDSKWYFEPVDVTSGGTYDYSHYYKSTATTDIVAQYMDTNGTVSYQYLATVAPATAWQVFARQLTIPATAKKMTIFHVVYSIGTLQLDDATLTAALTPPVDTAIIKNGSFETPSSISPSLPSGWETGSWGTNTPFYEYLNDAYTGTRSVKLTLTNYVDGDAKWYFTPVSTLTSGKMYRFSTKYKTNTIPKAVAQFDRYDGTTLYFGMPNPQPNGMSDWQSYSDTFTVPEGVKGVTVFFLLNSNGYVQLDDKSIVDYTPVGFTRPLVSLTFDDGFEDNNKTVLPMTGSYGFKTTQCYATQFVQQAATNPQLVRDFNNAGHEICSHTISHPFLTSLTVAQMDKELADSQAYLQSVIGGPVPNFASPYGDYNAAVNNEIKKYYRSHRTVDEGFNSKDNFDIYRIRVQNILSTTTATQVKSWVDQAKTTNTWLVLVYHKVGTTDIGPYDSYAADFAAQLKAIADSGITVKTYGAALDEVTTQL